MNLSHILIFKEVYHSLQIQGFFQNRILSLKGDIMSFLSVNSRTPFKKQMAQKILDQNLNGIMLYLQSKIRRY